MNKFHIYGPTKLSGKVNISGAKNSALPILFATLLTENVVEIKNIPKLEDINIAIKLLNKLGAKIKKSKSIYINPKNINICCPHYLSNNIRASIWILSPLLARFGYGIIPLPGGCAIGARPIDLHLFGLRKLGANVTIKDKYIKASVSGKLKGVYINMSKISVGATLTIMIAATLAIGTTIIDNAAKEPEIIDTANFLITLGAKIYGAGTNKIIINGVNYLNGGVYKILPDRIETGTFLVAAAISRGHITCYSTYPTLLNEVLIKLYEAGADIKTGENWISLNMHGKRPNGVIIRTSPYPGFPTDMQAQFSLLNLVANGVSKVTETIFENRFRHIIELTKMGAKAKIIGNTVLCYGVKKLFGTDVIATDLRSSISLILAGCIAQGVTTVHNTHYVYRGYDSIEKKLKLIGANIRLTNSKLNK
ncbi:MAG: UDP-N-acetylglucosamine 1-carboxyvinyltransferase [Candidatus Lightella neohaematopini]|nr:UDP-N-acetylglucosamine 1-carboxyvinyltransferase [Candidatus Lightella neohaematopini]